MTLSIKANYSLRGKAHISNYKKALSSVHEKKKIWEYLMKQREKSLKK